MKKIFSLFVALMAVVSLSAKTIYLTVNDDWKSYGAVFFVHSWGGLADGDAKLAAVSEGSYVFSATIPDDNNNLLFVRAQGDCQSIPWDTDKLWNKTADLEIPEGKDCYWLVDWTTGVWMLNGERPTVALVGDYGESMWGANPTNTMTPADGNATASVTLTLTAKTHEIKVLVAGYYMSLNGEGETKYQFNRQYCQLAENVNLLGSGRNFELVADVAGDYTFTWTYGSRNLVVEFPDNTPTAVENTTVADKVVKCIENGQLIIVRDGVQYNVLGGVVR